MEIVKNISVCQELDRRKELIIRAQGIFRAVKLLCPEIVNVKSSSTCPNPQI